MVDEDGFMHFKIQHKVYKFSQAGILTNILLQERLVKDRYKLVQHTPGLGKHKTKPITFTLIVNEFGINIKTKTYAIYSVPKKHYKIKLD